MLPRAFACMRTFFHQRVYPVDMLTSAEVARLEEPRQAGLLAAVTPLCQPFAGGVMGFHEPGSWQNQACGVGLCGPVSMAEVDELVAFYQSRGVEPRVELSPFADPSLVEGLGKRGFIVREFENVLSRALPAGEDLRGVLPHGWPEGLVICPVERGDENGIDRAVELTLAGFYPKGHIPDPMRAACKTTMTLASTEVFVAEVAGMPVAAGSLGVAERVASLMGVSTDPAYRRRGVQQALIAHRLQVARERGCVLATIASRPGIPTERNAVRMGFHVAYTRVVVVKTGAGLVPSP